MKVPVGLLFLISIICISFSAIFVKWSDAPATIISMYRMYLACFILLPIVWLKKAEFKKLIGKDWLILSVAGIFLGLHFALWFGSLKLTTVASSTIILSLQPIVALIGGYFIYKERANAFTFTTIGISVIGVALVAWGDLGHSSSSAIIGDILSFLSVIAIVAYLLIGQNKVKVISHWIYSFIVFFFAAFSLTIVNAFLGVPMIGYGLHEWGIFWLLAIFPTIAHVIFNFLLNYVNTTTVSMSILGEPIGATILAAILLGERITSLQLIGGVIALMGVSFFLLHQRKGHQVSVHTDAG